MPGATNANDVLKIIQDEGVEIIDLKFVDVPGTMQHLAIPPSEITQSLFDNGTGFDGSSIRGFQAIHESDMLIVPDPTTAAVDPFFSIPTISMICNIKDPGSDTGYSRDPRYIAQKAEAFLDTIADAESVGPRPSFR